MEAVELARVWDTETQTHTLNKRKGSPWHPDNYVVMHGWIDLVGEWEEAPLVRYTGGRLPGGWFKEVLNGANVLVGFNIKFDVLHAIQDPQNWEAWRQWVVAGGRIWDCQLAEYLLESQSRESHMLSLNEVALKYGGERKLDVIAEMWSQGIQTADIDPALLEEYLAGSTNRMGDLQNTACVYKGQVRAVNQGGMQALVQWNMQALAASIEMEHNGIHVDAKRGEKIRRGLLTRLEAVRGKINSYVPVDFPVEFNWASNKHKSYIIFGGSIEYVRSVPVEEVHAGGAVQPVYHMMDVPGVVTECGAKCRLEDLGERKPARYKSGVKKGDIKTCTLRVPDLSRPKMHKVATTYTLPGYVRPNPKWATKVDGVYSTASDIIESLGMSGVPFLKTLALLQKYTKDISTYYRSEDDSKGMLTTVGPDGLIHHSLNFTSTVTGRLSGSSPNFQNIPRAANSSVKRILTSRFSGGNIVQSDFSSLEVYCQAILTRDEYLVADLRAGIDLHCMRLASIEGISYEEVVKLVKSGDKAWKEKRTNAKIYSFQAAYGAGDRMIADTTGMTLERTKELRAADDSRYTAVTPYFKARAQEIKRSRKHLGRVVEHPDNAAVTCFLGRGWARTPDGKGYCYDEAPSPKYLMEKGITQTFTPTEIKNYEVQGLGAEVAKMAMWLSLEALYARPEWSGKVLLINQVHDAVYLDTHPDYTQEAAAVLHECLLRSVQALRDACGWDMIIDVPAETTYGPCMAVERPFKYTPKK